MGFLIAALLLVGVLAVLLVVALKPLRTKDPELDPEREGTSYQEPQDEGPV
jgi:hypothetical protein